jgi:hypothetical protein
MKYPSYAQVLSLDLANANDTEVGFNMIAKCISAILTEEERIDTKDVKEDEVMSFIEQMTADQFKNVTQFLQDIPTLNQDVEYVCNSCGHENKTRLKGINDFLS